MHQTKFIILICFIFLLNIHVISQDFGWWNNKHNWDGVTHWSSYIITSPGYMGPNALPVPEIRNGTLNDKMCLELGIDAHFSNGDKTQNAFLKINIPFANNRVAIESYWVPVEHFKMDTIIRDIRRARDYNGEGFCVGDIYFGTLIQITKHHNKLPDILIGFSFKTASGSNLRNARFTDSPAYFFDISFSKKRYFNSSKLNYYQPYAMLGFYVWQTNIDDMLQDDAFLYGGGIKLHLSNFEIDNKLGGYMGYINIKDSPLVYRLILAKNIRKIQYKFAFQQGLHDFKYSTFRLAIVLNLKKKSK